MLPKSVRRTVGLMLWKLRSDSSAPSIKPLTGDVIGLPQPKLSTLLRGRWASYSLDRLVRFTTLLGMDVTVRIEAAGDRKGHLTVAA